MIQFLHNLALFLAKTPIFCKKNLTSVPDEFVKNRTTRFCQIK
jgi:hypothetical protein